MPRYHYPSGIRIPDGDVTGWLIGLHGVFIALLIGALAVFVWRCFRKASLWDVPGWIVVAAIPWYLARWVTANFLNAEAQFEPYPFLMFVLVFIAANATLSRIFKSHAAIQVIVLVELAGLFFWIVIPAVNQKKLASIRSQCKYNLKRIGMAIFNYDAALTSVPALQMTKNNPDVFHSWRVALVPWYDASPVDKSYQFGKPWDSDDNIVFQKRYHHLYCCPSHHTDKRFTSYAMLTGPGTFGGDGLTATKLADITDGTSHTLMIVEACGREIIWTEPRDVEVTEESLGINLPGDRPGHSSGMMSSHHTGGAHGLLADGTVRFFAETMDKSVLRAMTSIDGGEAVPEF